MAKRRAAGNIACPVTSNTAGFNGDSFRLISHGIALAHTMPGCEVGSLIVERNVESSRIITGHLIGIHVKPPTDWKVENSGW